MLCRTQVFRAVRLPRCRLFSSKSSENDGKDGGDQNAIDKGANKISDATEKINLLLKSMMEDKAKMGSETFQSKIPREKIVIKKSRSKKNKDAASAEASATEKDLQSAISEVAESLGADVNKTKEELIAKTASFSEINLDWNQLIDGMKVDNTAPQSKPSRATEVHTILAKTRSRGEYSHARSPVDANKQQSRSIDIFGGQPLGIFTAPSDNTGTTLKMWDELNKRDLELAVTHPPANYFHKMIQWTKQGKLWKFPIDNEQGLEDEVNVHFSEHIFLEPHLEGWCPYKGPIRHFMELVCVGLSKNPYLTVQEKKDHIMWFKEYFETKKKLLKDVGALKEEYINKQLEA